MKLRSILMLAFALAFAHASALAQETLGTSPLPFSRGGTGLSSGTSGGVLCFTSATVMASSVAATANAIMLGGGAGACPTPLASLGTTTTVLHGNASGPPTFGAVALGTDVTGTLPAAQFPALTGDVTNTVGTLATTLTAAQPGAHTWAGDQYFKSGRPWCDVRANGAVGDGVTDDTAAIQGCINIVQAFALGGTVYFSPSSTGTYCTFTGVTVSGITSVRIIGGSAKTVLDACHRDVTTLTLNSSRSSVEYLQVWGKGTNADTTTFGASHPAISVGPNCVSCRLSHLEVLGGTTPLALNGTDALVEDVDASAGYGSAIAYVTAGQWIIRSKFDQGTPTTLPTVPFTINAWASTTVYTAKTIVSTQGYLIQCITGGTSGGSAPTLKNYALNITDGTVTWQLVSPANYYALQLDTAGVEVQVTQTDLSGNFNYALALTNTGAGTVPSHVTVTQTVFGGGLQGEIFLHDGSDLRLVDNEIGGCFLVACIGIYTNVNFTGDLTISNNIIWGSPTNIFITSGNNTVINGNQIFGASSSAITIAPGISNLLISNNVLGTSAVYGTNANAVIVQAGSSDWYNIVNNIVHGASAGITDGGTGTHKTIMGNN